MEFYRAHVLVCGGFPCVAAGCRAVRGEIERSVKEHGLEREVRIVETGCLGPCDLGPIVVVYPEGTVYSRVSVDDVSEIVGEHLMKGRPVRRLEYTERLPSVSQADHKRPDYFGIQERIVLENVGLIDPDSIEEYIARDGYLGAGMALTSMSPDEVISAIKASGLRGRGGAAFPTGVKLGFTARVEADQKYIICNADEGEPGTFKDRLILEGDPHKVIEGMIILGYSVGATMGYIYIRGEYYLSIERIERAIAEARRYGLLGHDLFGSGFSFDIEVKKGAGAYVCGEETALIESMEGKRGEPRQKPPYPGTCGLWGKPTVVNNVETIANVPPIVRNGADWFRQFGTPTSPGTKVYTLTGDVNNKGLIEVPMGITLREVIYGVGGGIPGGRRFKMAQTGGTAGGCLSETHLDIPMDYESLQETGSALGSGALLIIDDSHCVVDIACALLRFFEHESCGQCTPCREGTRRLHDIFRKTRELAATEKDLKLARELAGVMQASSLCALGQSVAVPLFTIMDHYADEIEAHLEGRCPAGVCRPNPANADESAYETLQAGNGIR
ncbi:MAG TPA: NADH-quinone oxidoreductase subunit NuoF [Bacillota bacterium]|jgi:NADP-reducing hydrogenase subunit HndC|nr:NADH-quinone oxidoreductase subunit NuoF [Bacillota bacterium]HOB41877.1 NADH-quinone oxidoreductase subunit NuoF [Bacillota bacterium]HPZ13005.1 NADH-quinone oxidoreductase subunit NuoF [Bacillota bacterium]HQD79536.1 NADH-quinone oxidoreductase subunit NuoF [Bacillota bacterium]